MTCLHYKALLDDYADKELSSSQAAELENHLKDCGLCRDKLDEIVRLKELLIHNKPAIPNSDYFDEIDQLIFAKTTEASEDPEFTPSPDKEKIKTDFFRAVMSAAAALVLLAASLVIGNNQDKTLTEINSNQNNVFVLQPIEELKDSDNSVIFTRAEQINQIRGMLMLGPPGTLGRVSAMYNFNRLQYK